MSDSDIEEIRADQKCFEKSPFFWTLANVTKSVCNTIFWLGFFALMTQCVCDGCIW